MKNRQLITWDLGATSAKKSSMEKASTANDLESATIEIKQLDTTSRRGMLEGAAPTFKKRTLSIQQHEKGASSAMMTPSNRVTAADI